MKKKIIIIGSTGSLGKSTLDIISNNKKNYSIELLVANKNFKTIHKQVIKFKPKWLEIQPSCKDTIFYSLCQLLKSRIRSLYLKN